MDYERYQTAFANDMNFDSKMKKYYLVPEFERLIYRAIPISREYELARILISTKVFYYFNFSKIKISEPVSTYYKKLTHIAISMARIIPFHVR